jgi:hypothetical protein
MNLKKHSYWSGAIALSTLILTSFSSQAVSASGDRLTHKQVTELIANAKTSADHMKLEKHFDATADDLAAQGREHAQLADQYRHTAELASDEDKPRYSAEMAEHCARLAEELSKAAGAARGLARDHLLMAVQLDVATRP